MTVGKELFSLFFLAMVCGILVLWPEIKPRPPAVEAQSPYQEFLVIHFKCHYLQHTVFLSATLLIFW